MSILSRRVAGDYREEQAMVTKRTWQPKKRRRMRVHGFRTRMSTRGGRKVLQARRARGRALLTVQKHYTI